MMANDLSRRPWSLDTPAVITPDRIRVKALRWVAPSAVAGNALTVEDKNGEVVASFVANGANFEDTFYPEEDFEGFELASIATGTLYVYYS